jgi:hypothetical protein
MQMAALVATSSHNFPTKITPPDAAQLLGGGGGGGGGGVSKKVHFWKVCSRVHGQSRILTQKVIIVGAGCQTELDSQHFAKIDFLVTLNYST